MAAPGPPPHFQLMPGRGKSASSSDPLSFFGTTKSVRTRNVADSKAFCGFGKHDIGFQDETDVRLRPVVHHFVSP